jgi:hypothetical protein
MPLLPYLSLRAQERFHCHLAYEAHVCSESILLQGWLQTTYSSKCNTLIFYIKPTWCTVFLSMFISFLYMFRATMCPSSGETTVSVRHLVFVTL